MLINPYDYTERVQFVTNLAGTNLIEDLMILNNTYGVMKINPTSLQLFFYNSSAEDNTKVVTLKTGGVLSLGGLRSHEFDRVNNLIFLGTSTNIQVYQISTTYDANGVLTDINW